MTKRLPGTPTADRSALHHQYSLAYYPDTTNWDGRFRKIQIEARNHGDRVTARKGYYAIPPQQR